MGGTSEASRNTDSWQAVVVSRGFIQEGHDPLPAKFCGGSSAVRTWEHLLLDGPDSYRLAEAVFHWPAAIPR